MCFLDSGRRPEDLKKTQAGTAGTCTLHTETTLERRTFYIQGNGANFNANIRKHLKEITNSKDSCVKHF